MSTEPTPLPPYPPQRVWTFPPPPVRRGWFWAAIAAMVTSALLGIALIVTTVVVESQDSPGLIDDSGLLAIIDEECADMTDRVESVDRSDVIDAIQEQNLAVLNMVELIDVRAGPLIEEDVPAAAWLDDWVALVEARDGYINGLNLQGDNRLEIPRDPDGSLIIDRMNDALIDGSCEVPAVLVDPRSGGQSI
ncbi:hypothetical protein [Aeromicrobium sp. CF3.5]|uniref:hypothetical protein n=1 Tax=Aeromicrobium sp. CF3.5 TaxID=3373078 RepID=UPI003EE77BF2